MRDAATGLMHGGYVALLTLHFCLLVAFFIWRLREIGRPAWGTRATMVTGLMVVVVAAALRWSLPASPQVIYDEFWYLSTARHMVADGTAAPLLHGGLPPRVLASDAFRPPYPQGWPFLEAAAMRVCGSGPPSWMVGVHLQRLIGVLACLALFAMFSGDSLVAATFAGCGLAVLPAFLRLSQGASSEGASALFVILALWAARSQRFRPGTAGALVALLACAWAMHFRPENLLYLMLFLPVAFVRRGRAGHWAGLLAGVLLFACFVGADFIIMVSGALGSGHDHFVATPRAGFTSWQANMVANLKGNFSFFVDGRVLPRWIFLMALVGTAFIARIRAFMPLALYWGWVLMFVFALSPYPFGDFVAAHSADTWRFSIQASLPLLLLGARGAEWSARAGYLKPLAAVLVVIVAVSTFSWWDFVSAPNPGIGVFTDLRAAAAAAPPGAVVVVDDESYAVTLTEGCGVATSLETGPERVISPELTAADVSAAPTACLLQVGTETLSPAWRDQPLRLLWTTGPAPVGRVGFTLYAR